MRKEHKEIISVIVIVALIIVNTAGLILKILVDADFTVFEWILWALIEIVAFVLFGLKLSAFVKGPNTKRKHHAHGGEKRNTKKNAKTRKIVLPVKDFVRFFIFPASAGLVFWFRTQIIEFISDNIEVCLIIGILGVFLVLLRLFKRSFSKIKTGDVFEEEFAQDSNSDDQEEDDMPEREEQQREDERRAKELKNKLDNKKYEIKNNSWFALPLQSLLRPYLRKRWGAFGGSVEAWIKKIDDHKVSQANKENNPVTEETIKLLSQRAKNLREQIQAKEQEKPEDEQKENFDLSAWEKEKEKRIEKLKKDLDQAISDLEREKAKFSEYVSSIEVAETESLCHKAERQLQSAYLLLQYWSLLIYAVVFVSAMLAGILQYLIASYFVISFSHMTIGFASFAAMFFLIMGVILFNCYQEVPHRHEWLMEWMGEHLLTWEAGAHFKFPVFMKRYKAIYLGEISLDLQMADSQQGEAQISSQIDFLNASAEVKATVFYRVFCPYCAGYEVDELKESISEKMEAGIRAYYGNKGLDEAIQGRANVDLRVIIIQGATEAYMFKNWGVVITGLAVTDINLPEEIKKQRNRMLEAEKELEVEEVKVETAKQQRKRAKIDGQAAGEKIQAAAQALGMSVSDYMRYELEVRRFQAQEKAKSLIAVQDSGGSKAAEGAVVGASMAVGQESAKQGE